MARRMPPLNPLRVFEVAARTGNLTRAADELHISQSAVSRQIAVLETWLDVRLFRRGRRGVTLTAQGEAYLRDIGPAFALIAAGTDRLARRAEGGPLRVRSYPTFIAKWLLPRLPGFQMLHPEIEVQLVTAIAEVDFDRDIADIAIQFGDGRWPTAESRLLFADELDPVCSPAILADRTRLARIEDLRAYRLLEAHYRKADWQDWLAAVGHPELLADLATMTFPSSMFAYQAAIDGMGIAIGQIRLLEQELATGQLVRPFARPVRRKAAYYMLTPAGEPPPAKVRTFQRWLCNEVDGAGGGFLLSQE